MPKADKAARLTTPDDWNNGIYDKRIGGAEYYKPGTTGRENPKRLAQSYFLLTIRDVAPQVLRELEAMVPRLRRVYQAEQDAWDAVPAKKRGSAKKIKVPARATFADWIFDFFQQVRDGFPGWLDDHEAELERAGVEGKDALRDLVDELMLWAERYRLANWMVEDFVTALGHYNRDSLKEDDGPSMGIAPYISSPGQMSTYPFGPEREEHRFNAYASMMGDPPSVNSIEAQVRATREGPDGEWVVEDDPRLSYLREFVFRFEGYDPTMMTQRRFKKFIEFAFKKAVQDYADKLELDLEQAGFKKCPEIQDTKMFKMAVERIVLGWPPDKIAQVNGCGHKAVEKALTRVKKWIDEPEYSQRKKRAR